MQHTIAAIKALFVASGVARSSMSSEVATQSIMASSNSIKNRADEFSRLLHGQRRDEARAKRCKASK